MGILSGAPTEEPLHYGEIYALWSASWSAKGAIACYSTLINHAGDNDLQKLLFDAVERARDEVQGIDALLKAAGIAPPPSLPDRPKADWSEIPDGARFTDAEISASLARDIAVGITALAQAMSQCIRQDAAALFAQLHAAKLKLAHSSLQLAKEKAWLVPPPLHKEPVPSR